MTWPARQRSPVRRHGGRRERAQAIARQIREASEAVAARHPGERYLPLNEVMKEMWRPEALTRAPTYASPFAVMVQPVALRITKAKPLTPRQKRKAQARRKAWERDL